MKNIVVFGAVQSGKSTLMGYMASSLLTENEFSEAVYQKEKAIRNMEIGGIRPDMILPSFVSLDRDELMDFAQKNTPGTSKRIHRKKISIHANGTVQSSRYTFIDTPGSRDRRNEQYSGMFEGEIGICVLSAIDVDHYLSLDQNGNKQKFLSEKRRLFTPIQFWNVYKGSENLIIVLSKCDFFTDSSNRLQDIYYQLGREIEKICNTNVPLIPTSIQLLKNEDRYYRVEQNIFEEDDCLYWYQGPTLVHELVRRTVMDISLSHTEFRLGAAIKICQIPNSSNFALRIKCMIGALSTKDNLIIGPIQNKEKENVYLKATVKSLKYEDGELSEEIQEGSIGGVAFANLCLLDHKSGNELLQYYKLLKTTVLMSGSYRTGNAVKLRIKDDELGESTFEALMQVYPKTQLQFYWLGRKMNADIIEHYESNGYVYISLANLSLISQGLEQQFALPILSNGYPYIECPVVLQYNEYRLEKRIEKYQVKTYALFHVAEIFSIDEENRWCIDMNVKACFVDSNRLKGYLGDKINVSVNKIRDGKTSIRIGNVTSKTAHSCFKRLRELAVDEGFCEYQLRFCEEKCPMQCESECY